MLGDGDQAGAMKVAWIAAAVAAMLLPWGLFGAATALPLSYPMSVAVIADLAWPVMVGMLISFGISRSGVRIPLLPAGDLVGLVMYWLDSVLSRGADFIAKFEGRSREWSVSAVLLILAISVLVAAMSIGI